MNEGDKQQFDVFIMNGEDILELAEWYYWTANSYGIRTKMGVELSNKSLVLFQKYFAQNDGQDESKDYLDLLKLKNIKLEKGFFCRTNNDPMWGEEYYVLQGGDDETNKKLVVKLRSILPIVKGCEYTVGHPYIIGKKLQQEIIKAFYEALPLHLKASLQLLMDCPKKVNEYYKKDQGKPDWSLPEVKKYENAEEQLMEYVLKKYSTLRIKYSNNPC